MMEINWKYKVGDRLRHVGDVDDPPARLFVVMHHMAVTPLGVAPTYLCRSMTPYGATSYGTETYHEHELAPYPEADKPGG